MEPAIKLTLTACGLFFLVGLLTGLWKYLCIARSADASSPVYVDIAHRASLLYSFACLVLLKFVELSAWSSAVDFFAALAAIVFFADSVLIYILHGWMRDTDQQLRKPHRFGQRVLPPALVAGFMWLLVIGEIGGFVVLFAGAMKTLYVL